MIVAKRWLIGLGSVAFSFGCLQNNPVSTLPFTVQIQLEGSDKSLLAGNSVEAAHLDNDQIRAFGEIDRDGLARLETYHSGKLLPGAQPGNYQIRIILNDDDPESKKKALKALDPKLFQFKTSGWKIRIPSETTPVLKLTPSR